MHFRIHLVSVLALPLFAVGCVGSDTSLSVTARVPGSGDSDPRGMAEELFAERLDRAPRLADQLTNEPPRSDWGQEGSLQARPAFEELARIRLDRINAELLTAKGDAAEALQRIRAGLRFEALEPALALNRSSVGPLRGLLHTGLLHLFLSHPLTSGPDLLAFRERLDALVAWTTKAAQHAQHIEGAQAPLPTTLLGLKTMGSPAFGKMLADEVSQKMRLAVNLVPSLQLETMAEIRILLDATLPASIEALLKQLDAPHRTQPLRGLVRQPGGLKLHQERVKQLVSAENSLSQIESRLTNHANELLAALEEIAGPIQFPGSGLDLLGQLRSGHDRAVGHPDAPEDRLALLTQRAKALGEALGPMLPTHFGTLPQSSILPPSLRPLIPGILQQSAQHSRGRAARVWVDPTRLRAASIDGLAASWILGSAALAACDHPGSDLPRWLRHAQWPGWDEAIGLYLARLSHEVQPGQDPWQRAATIGLELECVAHALTDIGLHRKGWTRAEGVQFLQARSLATSARVELMVDDCLDRPGLALAAPLSLQEILNARDILRQGRGVAFDLLAFHEALLEVGPLPVDLIGEGILRRLRR